MGRTPECCGHMDVQEQRDGQDARMPQAHGEGMDARGRAPAVGAMRRCMEQLPNAQEQQERDFLHRGGLSGPPALGNRCKKIVIN
jgi:hypothetical protein